MNDKSKSQQDWNSHWYSDVNLIVNVKCNHCGNTLPPHTWGQHLDKNHPVHMCPHINVFDPKTISKGEVAQS